MLGDELNDAAYRCESRRRPLEMASPRIARLLDVWRCQCAGAAMPLPGRAVFEDFAFAIGHIHLIDVLPDGRFHYRIFGTACHHPLNYHKRSTADIVPAALRKLVEADYRECVALAEPVYREVDVVGPFRKGQFRRLLLPYGLPGAAPCMLVSGVEENPTTGDVFRDRAFAPAEAAEIAAQPGA